MNSLQISAAASQHDLPTAENTPTAPLDETTHCDSPEHELEVNQLGNFYNNTHFHVHWNVLRQFLTGYQPTSGSSSEISFMVKYITVQIHTLSVCSTESLAKELLLLLRLSNAEAVVIELTGGGSLDGSDIETQNILRELAFVVEYIRQGFVSRFKIQKALGPCKMTDSGLFISYPRSTDLTVYWQAPTREALERFCYGEATFEECMHVIISNRLSKPLL